jgi:hypothetical protein
MPADRRRAVLKQAQSDGLDRGGETGGEVTAVSTADDRLDQFLVPHARCTPGPLVDGLTPEDIDFSAGIYWATVRCQGCGQMIREEQDCASGFREIARYAGMSVEEMLEVAAGDGGIEEIARRIEDRRRVAPEVLIRMMKARGERSANG